MFLNRDVLKRGTAPDALWLFLHCQRTGGSNLQRWFQGVFKPDEVFARRTAANYVQWHKMADFSVLRGKKLVSGFSEYRPHQIGRPLVAIANVRHPVYRIASLYGMSKKNPNHFMHDVAIKGSLEDFYRVGRDRRAYYFDNLLARRIGGVAKADVAIDVMHREFGLVAETNHLDAATKALIEIMGWPVAPIEPNGAPPDEIHYARYNGTPLFDEVVANNAEDMKLYEFVVNSRGAMAPRPQPSPTKTAAPMATASRRLDPQATQTDLDAAFAEYLKTKPGASYSQFYTTNVAAKVKTGHQHNSLGTNIVTGEISDFWDTGARQAKRMMGVGNITGPAHRVVEYGCGSLRLAAHFIKQLDRGNFFGLDIIPDFFEMGKASVGLDLIAEKQPRLAAISATSVAQAAAFKADYVFSHAVLIHVHPNDVPSYFTNLATIANKPSALLAFNAMLYDEPIRYNNLGWAWPEDFIVAKLPGFDLVKVEKARNTTEKGGYQVRGAMFTFRRT